MNALTQQEQTNNQSDTHKEDSGTPYDDMRKQHKQEIAVANSLVKEKDNSITSNKLKRSKVENKRFYEKENNL